MTIRDQLNKCKGLDTLTAFVEQKLAEAQAATVERCDSVFDDIARDIPGDEYEVAIENGTSLSLFTKYASKRVRALSTDPGWLDRQKQRAHIEGVKSVYVQHDHAIAGVCGAACPLKLRDLRVAELERQLGTLSAVTL